MSVLKNNRRPSPFEVFHHAFELRKDMTDLLLRDFGYKAPRIQSDKPKSETQLEADLKSEARRAAFEEWFIEDERKAVMDLLRSMVQNIIMANTIYPTELAELTERRIFQDKALGDCNRLLQELQYAIEVLLVDVNKYIRFADSIQMEIALIKGWRKSDNKYKKTLGAASDIVQSATNFANVNNNGNANNNSASNSNGVRPDFTATTN